MTASVVGTKAERDEILESRSQSTSLPCNDELLSNEETPKKIGCGNDDNNDVVINNDDVTVQTKSHFSILGLTDYDKATTVQREIIIAYPDITKNLDCNVGKSCWY